MCIRDSNDIKKISQCYKEAMAAINFRSINDEDDNGVIVYLSLIHI